MSRRDEILARYEESLFTLLMSEAAEWEGGRLLEEAERLNRDPAAEVPEAVSERCRRALRREFSRKGAAKFRRGLGRGLQAALAAAWERSCSSSSAFFPSRASFSNRASWLRRSSVPCRAMASSAWASSPSSSGIKP